MMSANCNHDCGSCGADCGERKTPEQAKSHAQSRVKKVIAIVSGKGGVGKSLVTSLLAVNMNRRGHKTAILDADVTGPSIPKVFGISGQAQGNEQGMYPRKSQQNIQVMSVNLLLKDPSAPVVWRGPIIAGTVKQFWSEVIWGEVDYMFVDMPPGTGDVPLTVFQSLPLSGIFIVTSPQELVSMIVEKAVNMANMMRVPILGLIENMSYLQCPDCEKKIPIFGESHVQEIAEKHGLEVLAKLPIDPEIARLCDNGQVESVQENWLENAAVVLENLP